jgi:hypothetical protein
MRALNPQIPTEPTKVNDYPTEGAIFERSLQILSPNATIYGTVHRTKSGESPVTTFIRPGKPNITLDSIYVIGDGDMGTIQTGIAINESTTADNLIMKNSYMRDLYQGSSLAREDFTADKNIFKDCRTGVYTKNPALITDSVFVIPKTLPPESGDGGSDGGTKELDWGIDGRIITIADKATSGTFDLLNTYVYTEYPGDPNSLEFITDPAVAEQYIRDLRTSATYMDGEKQAKTLAPDINFSASPYPHPLFPVEPRTHCFSSWKGYE